MRFCMCIICALEYAFVPTLLATCPCAHGNFLVLLFYYVTYLGAEENGQTG